MSAFVRHGNATFHVGTLNFQIASQVRSTIEIVRSAGATAILAFSSIGNCDRNQRFCISGIIVRNGLNLLLINTPIGWSLPIGFALPYGYVRVKSAICSFMNITAVFFGGIKHLKDIS